MKPNINDICSYMYDRIYKYKSKIDIKRNLNLNCKAPAHRTRSRRYDIYIAELYRTLCNRCSAIDSNTTQTRSNNNNR